MEDLIVIILTLIVAVVGSLGQIRKRKKGQPSEGNQKESQGFWEMLEGAEEQPETIVPEPVKSEKTEQPKRIDRRFEKGEPVTIKRVIEEKDLIKGKEPIRISRDQGIKRKTREKFPLRKAVIYSEILNRKYN